MKILVPLAMIPIGIWAMLHGLIATGFIIAFIGSGAVARNF